MFKNAPENMLVVSPNALCPVFLVTAISRLVNVGALTPIVLVADAVEDGNAPGELWSPGHD